MSRLKTKAARRACERVAAKLIGLPPRPHCATQARRTIHPSENRALAPRWRKNALAQVCFSSGKRRASQEAGRERIAKTYQSASDLPSANFQLTGSPIFARDK